MRPTPRLLIPLTLTIGLIVAACSDGGAASAPPADTPGDAPSDAAMVHTLDLADSSIGAIVVDATLEHRVGR
jgi:hypothetical protein